MSPDQVADNLRALKDEVLLLKDGMDYPTAIQLAEFCDRAIEKFDNAAEKYGAAFSFHTPSSPARGTLQLEDIGTLELQKKLLDDLERNIAMHAMTYHRKTVEGEQTPAEYAEAKAKIAKFLGCDKWPSKLFSHEDICLMAKRLENKEHGEDDVMDKINGAICKDFAQKLFLQQMKENKPVEEICTSFFNLDVLGHNLDGSLNKWVMEECQSIHTSFHDSNVDFAAYMNIQKADDLKKRCMVAAEPNAVFSRIAHGDKLDVISYCSAVSASFAHTIENRKRMNEMVSGKFEAFTRPIVTFLKATGMDEEKILRVFDGMKQTAEKMLGKSASMSR